MDFTLYWFMFPVSIAVATCAMLSGIGGAALFTPIFILVFPLLGEEYVLASTMTAIRFPAQSGPHSTVNLPIRSSNFRAYNASV